jgi:hypothetical protein
VECQCGLSDETTPLGHPGAWDNAPSPFVVPSVAGADDLVWLNTKGIVAVTNATA